MIKAPRGTVDILPQESKKWQELEQLIRSICSYYNVEEIRTPIFEQTELFVRSVGETTDVVNKEMYTFDDKKGRSMTLRPEGTAGVARSYIQNKLYANPEKVQKLFYMGPMFRYERPQQGRQRQFHQFGVEMIGYESPYLDVECMAMAITLVETLGIQDIKLHVNTLGDIESRDLYREVLKDYFRPALGDLCSDCQNRFESNPLRILDCKVDHDHPIMKDAPKTTDHLTDSAKAHFDKVCSLLDDLEIEYEVDSSLVRGLDYYNHTVFEIISDDKRLGNGATIGGGGRYNGLIGELGGAETPAVGFAFGLERIMLAVGDDLGEDEGLDCYIMPMGEAALDLSVQIAAMLRANGFKIDLDYQGRSFKGQFKSVDRFNAKFAMIIGDSELEKEKVIFRNTSTRDQEEVDLGDMVSYLEEKIGGADHHHE